MTADERIEGLLNRFGQTISDLPKADGKHHVYEEYHRKSAKKTVREWHKFDAADLIDIVDLLDMHASYICHLCDVIDRMEAAIETAAKWSLCGTCSSFDKHNFPECEGPREESLCFIIDDTFLYDEDVEVEDEDG